jgi:hypothetical protein
MRNVSLPGGRLTLQADVRRELGRSGSMSYDR